MTQSGRFWPFLAVFASFWPVERQIWVSKGCPLDNYCYSAQNEAISAISLKISPKFFFCRERGHFSHIHQKTLTLGARKTPI